MIDHINWYCRPAKKLNTPAIFHIRTEWYIDREELKNKCREILKESAAQVGHYVLVDEEVGQMEEFEYSYTQNELNQLQAKIM